jgi:hypothetical protein
MGEIILAFSDGIVHVRSAAPLNIWAKNHIGPLVRSTVITSRITDQADVLSNVNKWDGLHI